tara:strand:- start:206 stop:490 length:285 start_codon:yes stop_codon:yes gene_type:complete
MYLTITGIIYVASTLIMVIITIHNKKENDEYKVKNMHLYSDVKHLKENLSIFKERADKFDNLLRISIKNLTRKGKERYRLQRDEYEQNTPGHRM